MHDKDNTLAATRKDLLKPQTSQIKNLPQQSSNAVIEGFWGSLKADPAVGKMAECLEPSCQPWQQEPRPTEPPKQQEPEPQKRKHSKHKTHERWQGNRVDIVLRALFPGDTPTEAELANTDLYLKVFAEFERREWIHPPSRKTIRRRAGRLKD
jgi:hypothetical protein